MSIENFISKHEISDKYKLIINNIQKKKFDENILLNFYSIYINFNTNFVPYNMPLKSKIYANKEQILFDLCYNKFFKNKKIKLTHFISFCKELNLVTAKLKFDDIIPEFQNCFSSLEYVIPKSLGESSIIMLSKNSIDDLKRKYLPIIDKFIRLKKLEILIENNCFHPDYKFTKKEHIFEFYTSSLNIILKTMSTGEEEGQQVGLDLARMSHYINQKYYDYGKLNITDSNGKFLFQIFKKDLQNNDIRNSNCLDFIKKYAHQGGLSPVFSTLLLNCQQIENLNFSQNDVIIMIDYLSEKEIIITSIFNFKVRDMNTEDYGYLKISTKLSLVFQGIFKILSNNNVEVYKARLGLANVDLKNANDGRILKFVKNILLKESNSKLIANTKKNNTNFILKTGKRFGFL